MTRRIQSWISGVVRLIGKALSIKCKHLGRTLRDGCDSNMWNGGEEHDARQRDHRSKRVGAGKAPLSLGSDDSDGCGPVKGRRRRELRRETDS